MIANSLCFYNACTFVHLTMPLLSNVQTAIGKPKGPDVITYVEETPPQTPSQAPSSVGSEEFSLDDRTGKALFAMKSWSTSPSHEGSGASSPRLDATDSEIEENTPGDDGSFQGTGPLFSLDPSSGAATESTLQKYRHKMNAEYGKGSESLTDEAANMGVKVNATPATEASQESVQDMFPPSPSPLRTPTPTTLVPEPESEIEQTEAQIDALVAAAEGAFSEWEGSEFGLPNVPRIQEILGEGAFGVDPASNVETYDGEQYHNRLLNEDVGVVAGALRDCCSKWFEMQASIEDDTDDVADAVADPAFAAKVEAFMVANDSIAAFVSDPACNVATESMRSKAMAEYTKRPGSMFRIGGKKKKQLCSICNGHRGFSIAGKCPFVGAGSRVGFLAYEDFGKLVFDLESRKAIAISGGKLTGVKKMKAFTMHGTVDMGVKNASA